MKNQSKTCAHENESVHQIMSQHVNAQPCSNQTLSSDKNKTKLKKLPFYAQLNIRIIIQKSSNWRSHKVVWQKKNDLKQRSSHFEQNNIGKKLQKQDPTIVWKQIHQFHVEKCFHFLFLWVHFKLFTINIFALMCTQCRLPFSEIVTPEKWFLGAMHSWHSANVWILCYNFDV